MRVFPILLALFAGLLAVPAVASAAGACDLTTAVSPGNHITITGSGFAPGTVDITQTWSGSNATAGGNSGPETTTHRATADASGTFTYTIDAGPGRGGTYDIEATAAGCTATTQVTALETAGGINHGTTGGTTSGAAVTPPPTDTDPLAERGNPLPLAPIIPVLIGVALLGLAYVLKRRPA